MIFWTFLILLVVSGLILVVSGLIALPITYMQNSCVEDCFARMIKHDKVLCGELNVKDLPNSELLSLKSPLFTVVGMGGVGPRYQPSFDVFSLILDELRRRREMA